MYGSRCCNRQDVQITRKRMGATSAHFAGIDLREPKLYLISTQRSLKPKTVISTFRISVIHYVDLKAVNSQLLSPN